MEPAESGFEELLRLSQQNKVMEEAFEKRQREQVRREQEQARKKQTIRGLSEIKISVALGQLKMVAAPGVVRKAEGLTGKQGTGELRNIISELANDLETRIHGMTGSAEGLVEIERSVKTLAILIELLFSLE